MSNKPVLLTQLENEPKEIEALKQKISALLDRLPDSVTFGEMKSYQLALQCGAYDSVIHLLGQIENRLRVLVKKI